MMDSTSALEVPDVPAVAARHRRRLHRPRAGHRLRHARQQGLGRRDDAGPAAGRRSRPGQRAAQAAREAVCRDHAEHEGRRRWRKRRRAFASRSKAAEAAADLQVRRTNRSSIACSWPSDAARTRRFPASTRPPSRWTRRVSSRPTASGAPLNRRSSRLATSPASRCWRTRRRTRRASRSRRLPATRRSSSRWRFPPSSLPTLRSRGAA